MDKQADCFEYSLPPWLNVVIRVLFSRRTRIYVKQGKTRAVVFSSGGFFSNNRNCSRLDDWHEKIWGKTNVDNPLSRLRIPISRVILQWISTGPHLGKLKIIEIPAVVLPSQVCRTKYKYFGVTNFVYLWLFIPADFTRKSSELISNQRSASALDWTRLYQNILWNIRKSTR